MLAGLNENDAGDAAKLSGFCDGLVERFGCAVMVIHHKSDKIGASPVRGSSAFVANFDTVLEVTAHRQTKRVELRVRKHKDAEERLEPFTLVGHAIAGSLVFDPTSAGDHRDATAHGDQFSRKAVGAALQALAAIGREAAKPTSMLAELLIPRLDNEDDAARKRAVGNGRKQLSKLAKPGGPLQAYKVYAGNGRDLLWCLPEQIAIESRPAGSH